MMAVSGRSPATAHAVAFVAAHHESAEALGGELVDLVNDPDAFAARLDAGLRALADPAYQAGQHSVAPGLGPVHGVRWPLLAAVSRTFRRGTRHDRPTPLLFVADRLLREPILEMHWFAFGILERTLDGEPERTWQLMRRAAREAGDWITVDSLAHAYVAGVLSETYRWAELEQLVYSADKWERRLVGATIARLPFELPRQRRAELANSPGLTLIKSLIGDSEPNVQKALSWALRSWNEVDEQGVGAVLRDEADSAARTDDGNRAWVVRDALTWPGTDPRLVAEIRSILEGVHRRTGGKSTSVAAAVAGAFTGLDRLSEQAVMMQGDRQRLAGR